MGFSGSRKTFIVDGISKFAPLRLNCRADGLFQIQSRGGQRRVFLPAGGASEGILSDPDSFSAHGFVTRFTRRFRTVVRCKITNSRRPRFAPAIGWLGLFPGQAVSSYDRNDLWRILLGGACCHLYTVLRSRRCSTGLDWRVTALQVPQSPMGFKRGRVPGEFQGTRSRRALPFLFQQASPAAGALSHFRREG